MSRRVALLHHSIGPYHVPRAEALSAVQPELTLVELAASEQLRKWTKAPTRVPVRTCVGTALEEARPKEITAALERILASLEPDVVIIAGYALEPFRAAASFCRKRGKKAILLSDSHAADKRRWAIKETLKGAWVRAHFDAAFTAGAAATEYLAGLGYAKERIWRGYDVVDNGFFARAAASAPRPASLPKGPYFLFVGRFSPEKNLGRLIGAWDRYRRAGGAWPLVLVGSGPAEPKLKAKSADVTMPGFLEGEVLAAAYANAGALLLPSVSEPWGLVINEAMACGAPILASTACGAVPDLVFPGVNGALLDPTSEAQMAEAMTRFSALPEERRARMSQRSRELVARLTPETWAEALSDCIEVTAGRV